MRTRVARTPYQIQCSCQTTGAISIQSPLNPTQGQKIIEKLNVVQLFCCKVAFRKCIQKLALILASDAWMFTIVQKTVLNVFHVKPGSVFRLTYWSHRQSVYLCQQLLLHVWSSTMVWCIFFFTDQNWSDVCLFVLYSINDWKTWFGYEKFVRPFGSVKVSKGQDKKENNTLVLGLSFVFQYVTR